MSGRIVVTTWRAACMLPRRDSTVTQSPSAMPQLLGQLRVHLDARLGVLVDQRADAPRLGAGQELADDAAGGQDDRILGVDVLGRRRVRRRR